MKFKRRLPTDTGLSQFDIIPFVNILFLLVIFFILNSSFITVTGMNVNLPKVFGSQNLNQKVLNISISSEDTIYINDKPFVFKELEVFVKEGEYDAIFIRSDKDASLGIVAQIWDICKKLGIERIGIATTYN